jgi:hypothetical protein
MPMQSVTLRPGVDVQKTFSVNEAGVSQSQLMRYKDGLIQTQGGWQQFYSGTFPSTVRDLHAWQGLTSNKFLGIGGTMNLAVINSGTLTDITPQTATGNAAPNFSITNGSNLVTVVDASSVVVNSIFNTVFFNTPISIGGLLLQGAYPINTVLSSDSYTILSSVVSSATVTSSGVVPVFDTSSGSVVVSVELANHTAQAITGLYQSFYAATQITSNLTIVGAYQVSSVPTSSYFKIQVTSPATVASSFPMNGGNAQLVYYITNSVIGAGAGAYSAGAYSSGAYGIGVGAGPTQGTPISATDWTLENWGEIFLACPKNGPIYLWSPNLGFLNAQVINQAPFFNGGIFVSEPQQILVAWASCQSTGSQDPLIVRWCNSEDFTNWTVSNQTTAGSFHFSSGSEIRGGIQGPNFAMIFTDIEAWQMNYVGGTVVFNFTKIGEGCGILGPHACTILAGQVFWVAQNNIFVNGGNGAQSLPCPVWDFLFQNLSAAYQTKTKLASNSSFNELACFFPSAASTGENDSYVKAHIEGQEFEWDYGSLSRTAWIDLSVLGQPIGVDAGGIIWQHEMGNVTSGASSPFFRSGWWALSDGNDLQFVDFIIPDFIWGTFSGAKDAQVLLTFYVADYPGDTPRQYGPYTVTQATEYINVRFRGRLMSVLVQSGNSEFWRLGRIRFRIATSGRR